MPIGEIECVLRIDREVALPDLLAELTTTQVQLSPRLPTGRSFWFAPA